MSHKDIEYTRIEDIRAGDFILDENNEPTLVNKVHDIHLPKEMYKIIFDDGFSVECSGNHLWYCETEDDLAFKETYKYLIKIYNRYEKIPELKSKDMFYTKEDMISLLSGENYVYGLLVQSLLDTLGPSISSINPTFDNYMDCVSIEEVFQYSYNDLIKLWHRQSDPNQYFLYGKTRTTSVIMNTKGEINIPTTEDLNRSRLL